MYTFNFFIFEFSLKWLLLDLLMLLLTCTINFIHEQYNAILLSLARSRCTRVAWWNLFKHVSQTFSLKPPCYLTMPRRRTVHTSVHSIHLNSPCIHTVQLIINFLFPWERAWAIYNYTLACRGCEQNKKQSKLICLIWPVQLDSELPSPVSGWDGISSHRLKRLRHNWMCATPSVYVDERPWWQFHRLSGRGARMYERNSPTLKL